MRIPFDPRLLLVLDPTVLRGRPVEELVEAALRGGVTSLQVREKFCSNEEFLALARRVIRVARRGRVTVLLNDRVDAVPDVGADGVHVGQSDLAVLEARRRLGPDAWIGLSVETPAQAERIEGADYLGVSAVFATPTKPELTAPWGLEGLSRLRPRTTLPLVGIGGVRADNAGEVIRAGADGVAVVSEICANPWPEARARRLREAVDEALEMRRFA